jgi:hypothetical protein
MKPDPSTLEDELRNLQATPLDDALLARLEGAAEGTWTDLTADELRFESQLRGIRPASFDEDFLATLSTITAGADFPGEQKIVSFPKPAAITPARQHRSVWRAAAAVALIGGLSALLLPTEKKTESYVAAPGTTTPSATAKGTKSFIPASFGRGLKEVHDEGVIWKSNEPHRVLRVIYKDHMTLKDANGRIVEVEEPREQYMLVPARTD